MPQDLGDRGEERPFGAADRRSEQRRDQSDEPDHGEGERVLRPDERPHPEHMAVAAGVLEILLDEEADRDDGEEGEPRARGASRVTRVPARHPTSAERGCPPLQSDDADPDRKARRKPDDGEREAHASPVIVRGMPQRADKLFARPHLRQEDGVVAHEQGDGSQRPERDPCPHSARER